jgi:hypothetical protein
MHALNDVLDLNLQKYRFLRLGREFVDPVF